jgi:hypothetical protein
MSIQAQLDILQSNFKNVTLSSSLFDLLSPSAKHEVYQHICKLPLNDRISMMDIIDFSMPPPELLTSDQILMLALKRPSLFIKPEIVLNRLTALQQLMLASHEWWRDKVDWKVILRKDNVAYDFSTEVAKWFPRDYINSLADYIPSQILKKIIISDPKLIFDISDYALCQLDDYDLFHMMCCRPEVIERFHSTLITITINAEVLAALSNMYSIDKKNLIPIYDFIDFSSLSRSYWQRLYKHNKSIREYCPYSGLKWRLSVFFS